MITVELLTPAEVAKMFRVDPKTVTRWAAAGKLRAIKTLGGHRRFVAEDVYKLLQPDAGTAEGRVCFKCRGNAGEVIDRGVAYGDKRYMHVFGRCPS